MSSLVLRALEDCLVETGRRSRRTGSRQTPTCRDAGGYVRSNSPTPLYVPVHAALGGLAPDEPLGSPTGLETSSRWQPDGCRILRRNVDPGVQQGGALARRHGVPADVAWQPEE